VPRAANSTKHVRKGRHSVNVPTQRPCKRCGRNTDVIDDGLCRYCRKELRTGAE
jgi:hypothetical protein